VRQAAELIDTLSAPGFEQDTNVVDGPNPAADGQRHEDLLGGAANHIEHDAAVFVAGGDVEVDQLIGALALIARGNLHGIAGVAEIEKIRPLDHPPAIDIQARNDPLGQHS
jgi:hypothetical protein